MKIPITTTTKPKQTLVSGGSGTHPSNYVTNAKVKEYTNLAIPSCGAPTEYDLSTSLPHQD